MDLITFLKEVFYAEKSEIKTECSLLIFLRLFCSINFKMLKVVKFTLEFELSNLKPAVDNSYAG